MTSDFTYEAPNEEKFRRAVIITLNQGGHSDIASLLERSKCTISHTGSFSRRRWNAFRTTVNFEIPMDIYDYVTSRMTDETKEIIRSVCAEVMPPKSGLDVMEVKFSVAIVEIPAVTPNHDLSDKQHAATKPETTRLDEEHDVFICHASEDKEAFVRRLALSLRNRGLKVWYDEFALALGDSLRRKIDQGLATSRYGIVVLSESFFKKGWPQTELDGLAAKERNGVKVILPVWHGVTRDRVASFSITLADRYAASTDRGMDYVIDEILKVVRPQQESIVPTPKSREYHGVAEDMELVKNVYGPIYNEMTRFVERRSRFEQFNVVEYNQVLTAYRYLLNKVDHILLKMINSFYKGIEKFNALRSILDNVSNRVVKLMSVEYFQMDLSGSNPCFRIYIQHDLGTICPTINQILILNTTPEGFLRKTYELSEVQNVTSKIEGIGANNTLVERSRFDEFLENCRRLFESDPKVIEFRKLEKKLNRESKRIVRSLENIMKT